MSFKQIFDARGMSVRGDGVTDDGPAIANALNLIGNGNTLSFPSGNYYVKTGITLMDQRNMYFEAGATVTAGSGSALIMSGAGNMDVTGFGTFVGASGSTGLSITSAATGSLGLWGTATVANAGSVVVSGSAGPQMYLVGGGDSIIGNNGPTGTANFLNQLGKFVANLRVQIENYGAAGKKLSQTWTSYSSTTGLPPSYTVDGGHRFSPAVTGVPGVYFVQAGVNDISQGDDALNMEGYITSLVTLAHADGYIVVVNTITPNGASSWTSTMEGYRQTYNAFLRAGSSGADLIFDAAALLTNTANTAWFNSADTLHWTAAAHVLAAQEIWSLLNGGTWIYRPHTKAANNGFSINGGEAVAQHITNWAASSSNDDDPGQLLQVAGVNAGTGASSGLLVGTISSFSGSQINMTNSFAEGQSLRFTSTGTLPTGISTGTDYWVTSGPTSAHFSVASSPGGSAISLSGGSGTHSVFQNWAWVAPRTGVVRVNCRLMHTYNGSSDEWRLWVYHNMAASEMLQDVLGASSWIGGTADINVAAGDTLDVRIQPVTSSGTLVIYTNAGFSEVCFLYVR